MKKIKVKPYGYLYTKFQHYFLLSPRPIVRDSWMKDKQEMWNVVTAVWDDDSNLIPKGGQRFVICNMEQAVIELGSMKPILIESDNWEDETPLEEQLTFQINTLLENAEISDQIENV